MTLNVQLSVYGNLTRHDLPPNGTTPVPGARSTSTCRAVAASDDHRRERYLPVHFLQFTSFTITVFDPATRGRASRLWRLHDEREDTDARHRVPAPQGAMLVTVVDADGQPINGASVPCTTHDQRILTDTLTGRHRLGERRRRPAAPRPDASPAAATITASSAGLSGSASAIVSADTVTPVTIQLEPRATITGNVLRSGRSDAGSRLRYVIGSGGGPGPDGPESHSERRRSLDLHARTYAVAVRCRRAVRAMNGSCSRVNGEVKYGH
ncbi:MAG: hypothetical protein QM736_02980 [Vicinamibacterales bacterium]